MAQDWIARGREVLDIEIAGLENVRKNLDEAFGRAVTLLAACRGRVAITGIGKSGLVGRKMAATLSSTGTPAYFLHPVEGAHGDLGSVREEDVVIAISYSGRTDELNALLPAVSRLGARIIAITSNRSSPLARLSDIVLDASVPREACPMNLAPTASTTATLALGDALAVCLMDIKAFTPSDFRRYHPGGALGQRLSLRVGDIMHTKDLPRVLPGDSLALALERLDAGRLGAVVICREDGALEGILTDGDVRRILVRDTLDPDCAVETVMTAGPRHARPDQSAAELMDLMEETGITVVPVVDAQQRLAGVVHLHDLLGKGQIRFSGES